MMCMMNGCEDGCEHGVEDGSLTLVVKVRSDRRTSLRETGAEQKMLSRSR